MYNLKEYIEKHNMLLHTVIKGKTKVNDNEFVVPKNIQNIKKDFSKFNYNIKQLKLIAKKYNLSRVGNKCQLQDRILTFGVLSEKIIMIQKIFRCYLVKLFLKLKGNGAIKREKCINEDDVGFFISLKEIALVDFFSYTDKDNFTYGFELDTIEKIIRSTNKNPYNRKTIPKIVENKIKQIKKITEIIGVRKSLRRSDSVSISQVEITPQQRAINLFNAINDLGNYSCYEWFLELSSQKLIKFIRELSDIWNYRASLTPDVKRMICPQSDPFENIMNRGINAGTHEQLQHLTLEICEKMVNTGVDYTHKSLGSMYVLSTFTMVSVNAAEALPWLYESVVIL